MIHYLLKLVVTAIVVIFTVKMLPPLPMSSYVTQKNSVFTVSGKGSVETKPDIAVINIEVVADDIIVTKAQNVVNRISEEVIKKITALGIDSKDIKTFNYSISPRYSYQNNITKIQTYEVSNGLTIKVRNLDSINDVIDNATKAGANRVNSIRFEVAEEKQKSLMMEARVKAIAEAKEKAKSLSEAAGLRLGKIIDLQEHHSHGIGMQAPTFVRSKMAMEGGVESFDTNIQTGSLDITTNVSLSFELR